MTAGTIQKSPPPKIATARARRTAPAITEYGMSFMLMTYPPPFTATRLRSRHSVDDEREREQQQTGEAERQDAQRPPRVVVVVIRRPVDMRRARLRARADRGTGRRAR